MTATQDWTPGSIVKLGGREYRVIAHEKEAPAKGLAKGVELHDEARDRRYTWRPYAGLQLQGDLPLVRDRRAQRAKAKPRKQVQAPTLPTIPVVQEPEPARGVWGRLKARFGLRRQAPKN